MTSQQYQKKQKSSKKVSELFHTAERTVECWIEQLSALKSSEVIVQNDVNIYELRGMRHSHI